VLGELRAGFASGAKRNRNGHDLQAFRANPVVEVLDVDDAASVAFARVSTRLLG